MKFSKLVSSYLCYCQHSRRFWERGEDRQQHTEELQHLFRGVVEAVTSQVSAFDASEKEGMLDVKADEYLKEWVNAGKIRRRCVVPECHPFSLTDADAAKHALDVYGRIIGVHQFIQDAPLLAQLAHMVIRDELGEHNVDTIR